MKKETKLKRQLADVEEWLAKARSRHSKDGLRLVTMEFYTLVALEQLLKYEKMKLEGGIK